MFEKTHAAKANADPLYRTLGDMAGEYPQWNFHKYVLDRQGRLIASYNSRIEPQSKTLIETIERLL